MEQRVADEVAHGHSRGLRRKRIYGGYTSGLEEAGLAPDNAVNRQEVLPPISIRQLDAGVRLAISSDLRLIAGGFRLPRS